MIKHYKGRLSTVIKILANGLWSVTGLANSQEAWCSENLPALLLWRRSRLVSNFCVVVDPEFQSVCAHCLHL